MTTTESVKPLTYPSGQFGWPELPSTWELKFDQEGAAWIICTLVYDEIWIYDDSINFEFYGPHALTHEEADALEGLRQWCRIQLQEHRRGEALPYPRSYLSSCSCSGGVWEDGIHYAKVPMARQVDVIEAT